MLEEQQCKIQKRHEEGQWLQTHLEEVAKTYSIEHTSQKARKVTKAKAREKAKRWRLVEEEDKRKWMKYLQQL